MTRTATKRAGQGAAEERVGDEGKAGRRPAKSRWRLDAAAARRHVSAHVTPGRWTAQASAREYLVLAGVSIRTCLFSFYLTSKFVGEKLSNCA